MDNFHIYREGQYDRKANLKVKIDAEADRAKERLINVLQKIDGFFVNH